MIEHERMKVLTDAQWDQFAPLIEACRPRGKTQPQDLRRTLEAIIWRHQNGAKWRSIPPELGPWWRAAQLFIRWSRMGVWERLLELAQERGGVEMGMSFLDGSSIRAHQKAAGAAKKGGLPPSVTSVRQLAARAGVSAPRLA
jgi:transposase